jgi:hypothetical protein
MRIDVRFLIPFLLLMALLTGCDSSENPNLLNPPLPDSTQVRVVNLVPDGTIDVLFPGMPVATGLAPYRVSPYKGFLQLTPVPLVVRREGRERLDTALPENNLSQGARITYLVLRGSDTASKAFALAVGKQQIDALISRGTAQVYFINAVDDASSYYLKEGCQSGPRVFESTPYAGEPKSIEWMGQYISLYLFNGDSIPITTAHIATPAGSVSYVIAAKRDGAVRLYLLTANGTETGGPILEAPPETESTANVALLNATADAQPISATIAGSVTPIGTGVAPLSIAGPTKVEACIDPLGDSLLIDAGGAAPFKAPISLRVGGHSLVVVYDRVDSAKAIVLNLPDVPATGVFVRAVNIAPTAGDVSISIGAGAPNGVSPDYRPFGSLAVGATTDYVALPAGRYPWMLSNASTGKFQGGGVENLSPGYYTLFVVERLGAPSLMIVQDNGSSSSLKPLDEPGVRTTFFNLIPGTKAQFTVGPLLLPDLAYSYVFSTILPLSVNTIGSNAGQATVDPGVGGYVAGLTGSGTDKKLLAFPADTNTPPTGKAAIRFLHAVPDGPELMVRIGKSTDPPADSSFTYGVPTPSFLLDERKYSFFITPKNDTTVLAKADGVQLIAGRHYLVALAPKNPGSTSAEEYTLLVIQE